MEEEEKGGSSMLLSKVIKVNEITEKPQKKRKPTEEEWNRVRTIIYNRLFYRGGDQLLLQYWRKEITYEEYKKKFNELVNDNLHLFMDIFS